MQPAMLLTRKDLARLHRANKILTDLVTRLECVLGEVSRPVVLTIRPTRRRKDTAHAETTAST